MYAISKNAEITPMYCCLGEPDCLAGIMLLFKTDWQITCRHGRGLVSILVLLHDVYNKLVVFVSNFYVQLC